jgi:hypothetical protein
MGKERIYVIPLKQMNKAIVAFRKEKKTHLSYILIAQAFKDRNITMYEGENAMQFSQRMTDNFLDLIEFEREYHQNEIIEMITGYYNIIYVMLGLP